MQVMLTTLSTVPLDRARGKVTTRRGKGSAPLRNRTIGGVSFGRVWASLLHLQVQAWTQPPKQPENLRFR